MLIGCLLQLFYYSSISNIFFPLSVFKIISLYFIFSGLNMKFFGVILSYLSYSKLSYLLGLVYIMFISNFRKFLPFISSNLPITPFSLFFWNFSFACIKPFNIVPQLSDAMSCFSFFSPLLCFVFSFYDLLSILQVH